MAPVACAGGPVAPSDAGVMMPPPAGFGGTAAGLGGPGGMEEPLWLKYQMYPECTQFLDETVDLRRQYHIKMFDYFEAARKPETSGRAMFIEQEMRRIFLSIDARAPMRCRGGW